jgi:hypothetical protein
MFLFFCYNELWSNSSVRNCAPLLVDLLLYSCEADWGLLKKNEKKLARSFNFIFHYIDDVLSLNKSTFYDFVDRICLI